MGYIQSCANGWQHKSWQNKKFRLGSNIFASPKAGWGNRLVARSKKRPSQDKEMTNKRTLSKTKTNFFIYSTFNLSD